MSSIQDTNPSSIIEEDGVRFGRTLVGALAASWEDAGFDVAVMPNNQRGLVGVNFTSRNRVDGGLDVEREVMRHAPMTLGTAEVSAAGTLQEHGIRHIVHAIVSEDLGDPPRETQLRQAMQAAMHQVESIRGRNVLILPLGSGSRRGRVDRVSSFPMMIEEIIGHLRRRSSRIERVTMLCNSVTEVRMVEGLLTRMRRDWWRLRG